MKSLLLILTFVALSFSAADALTADELGMYLGVTSWKTKVTLPPESFIVELHRVKNGSAAELLYQSEPMWSRTPENGVQIMCGPENGKYKFIIINSSGDTSSWVSKIPIFNPSLSTHIPKEIQQGDFMLFGTRQPGRVPAAGVIDSYSDGVLLRIKKKG